MQETPPTSLKEINEDEESLSDIIWQIVKEELAAHEITIKALINSNLKATNELLDKIVTEMDKLSKNLEFTPSQLDKELGNVKKDTTKLENNIKSIEKDLLDPDDVSAKRVELEDRSWRNNLRIDGLWDKWPNETWKICEWKVQEVLKNNLAFATEVKIDRCHPINSRNQSGQHPGRPRTIICRFNKFKDKQQILNNAKKLRSRGIYIYKDFSKGTMDLWKTIWEKVLQYYRQNKFACLNYRSIIVRDFDNVRWTVSFFVCLFLNNVL